MTPVQLALRRAQDLLVVRLTELAAKITAGDESVWPAFCEAATALAAIAPQALPEGLGGLLTTRQMADRLGLTPRTLRRRAKVEGVEPIRFAKRGSAALRWPAR